MAVVLTDKLFYTYKRLLECEYRDPAHTVFSIEHLPFARGADATAHL